MSLFKKENFTSHSGLALTWKLECGALTKEDWECLAFMISEKFSFGEVVGVDNGGILLAAALRQYENKDSNILLLVDDVLTTGASMNAKKQQLEVNYYTNKRIEGVVVFNRNGHSWSTGNMWIHSLFKIWS